MPDPTTPLFHLQRGDAPLVISVPHAGVHIPADIAAALTPLALQNPDADWHVDKLYGFAPALGATLLVATHARTVVDLNRPPAGEKLYPGQAETSLCPTETFAGASLYAAAAPDDAEIDRRRATYWAPYHAALAAELDRLRTRHGHVRLLDAHSILPEVPRLFDGRLPDLNFGTNGGVSAPASLVARALEATRREGFTQVLDGRFKGGYITRHYGGPERGRDAIQLELAQSTYLDLASPARFDAGRAAPLIAVLQNLVRALLDA